MLPIPGMGGLVSELRQELAAQRGCLNTIIRQLGREYQLADPEQAPGNPHETPVIIQQHGAGPGLGAYDLRARLPANRYAMRGYVTNQHDEAPLWLQIVMPNGETTPVFMLAPYQTWPFPCNVASVKVLADPSDSEAMLSDAWQLMAQ